jgi:serine protease Do
MKKGWAWAGVAALTLVALSLPLVASGQKVRIAGEEMGLRDLERMQEKLERELARVERLLESRLAGIEERIPSALEEKLAALEEHKLAGLEDSLQDAEHALQEALAKAHADGQAGVFFSSDGESGWLGVSVGEVTAEKAKELKLPAERGVVVDEVDTQSPAAKAGLKKNDVITEFNGQRVEGAAQFRRLVRETPPGRVVQLTVWREGRAQQISATLGDWGDYWRDHVGGRLRERITTVMPRRDFDFSFRLPDVQLFSSPARPLLGIRTEDLEGQLGAYFGAPENEGVLVTHVNSGSPAEKAGMKAGDVIVKVNGRRVRNTSDLREGLRDARDKKMMPVAVIRKGAETTLNVEIELPKPPERTRVTRRITL